ncbi:hypothetical protein T235_06585 [Tannerella sp. oral taxon BU063 isolate Cell 8/11]|uniref:Uncharacterized protein n=1 Tax=Tannerella sp. oral taxon BU063 isolate Cell 8/11 TaxID=1411915 RepID=W2D0C2_9BACT|nr:hypothetical protein T235_06585 [Tannerella sp. oral taxon BU063 isolate Cell 8/11]
MVTLIRIYMCMMKSVWWAAKVGQFVGVPWGGGVEAWAFVDADSSFSGPGLGHPLRHPHRRVIGADVQADGQGRGTVGFMLDPF